MSGWATVVVSLVAAVLSSGGVTALVYVLARRPVTKVEAVDRLNQSTLEWAEDLKADAASARAVAGEAWVMAQDARRELAQVRREAHALAVGLRRLRLAILAPDATLEQLRSMAGDDSGNGVATESPDRTDRETNR